MLSHYGSEHYCPLSLLRVLGASMMEVYEYSERREQSGRSVILPPSEGEIMGMWGGGGCEGGWVWVWVSECMGVGVGEWVGLIT